MKQHYAVLDGLRGVAAVVVVLFHIRLQSTFNPMEYASYAVDFFYVLSGFVVALAYEKKLTSTLSFRQFMTVRLIRLYPLIFLGISMGIALAVLSFLVQGSPSISSIALAGGLGLLLLPSYVFPQWETAYPFNTAAWSLSFEVAVNIVYASIALHLTNRRLIFLIIISATALVAVGLSQGSFRFGSDQVSFLYGFVRVTYPFFIGVALFRIRPLMRPNTLVSVLLLVFLTAILILPIQHNVFLGLALVILVMPAIVWSGAGVHPVPRVERLMLFIGQLSYPIYILHAPLLRVGAEIKHRMNLTGYYITLVDAIQVVSVLVFAYLALKFFDEPLRSWLNRRSRPTSPSVAAAR